MIIEITPYYSLGIAQLATMTVEQAHRISEHARSQASLLRELGREELFLDMTYVREERWEEEVLGRVPAGSTVFPVADLRTVPLHRVKHYLQ